jgi:Domain of unknown function (DUF4386)
MNSIQKTARTAGLLYLIFIITLAFSSYARSKLILFGDAAATARNIVASGGLFRLGFISELVSAVFFLLAAWALYALLKPVNKDLALLFLSLNLGGVAVECMNMLNLLAAPLLVSGAGYLQQVFQAGQLQALALLFLNLYSNGFMIAQIFYGAWLLPLGYLVFKSGFLPRILGVLLMLDCLGVLIWFIQFFFLPAYPVISYPGLAVSFIAEVGLSLWLLIKGVRDQQPASIAAG